MMMITFLAISLSLDALGIGATYGIRGIVIPPIAKLILGCESLILMSLAILFGNRLILIFSPNTGKYLGVILLLAMGIYLCFQGIATISNSKNKKEDIHTNNMVRTPSSCDRNKSSRLDPTEAILLGFVLSIDSIGAGIGAGAAGISIIRLSLAIALFQIVFLSIGTHLGKRLALLSRVPESFWSIISGSLLIVIGILRIII